MKSLQNITTRTVVGTIAGAALCFGLGELLKLSIGGMSALQRQWIFKGLLIVVALIAWKLTCRSWAQMGWQRARPTRGKWIWYLIGALAMGLSSIAMILTKQRHPIAAQLTFPQIIVTVWLLSSISEEIFVRGLVQSWIAVPFDLAPRDHGYRIVILASAQLFGGLHVPLIWMGGGLVGGGIIVAATFLLGWAAAEIRARTGSLLHAIGVHIVGNVAALPFAVIGVILYRLLYGEMPALK